MKGVWLVSEIFNAGGYISTTNKAVFKDVRKAIKYVMDAGVFKTIDCDSSAEAADVIWTETLTVGEISDGRSITTWDEIRYLEFLDETVS